MLYTAWACVSMFFAILVTPLCVTTANAAQLQESPVIKVLELLRSLKAEITQDGQVEQKSFDKYACWCEQTMQDKVKDIAAEKTTVEKMDTLIKKLKGELGAHSSEVEQLKKDIKENEEAQQEASEVRAKENEDYVADKSEAEQCIGALEAAIKVLRGAGTGSKGFLQSFKEAQLISVAADVQRVFRRDWSEIASEEDIDKVKSFFANPRQAISALQVMTSPYGDYAPQSTQIQGILKGM